MRGLNNLGFVALARQDWEQARSLYRESLLLAGKVQDHLALLYSLVGSATLLPKSEGERAPQQQVAWLAGAAEMLRLSTGTGLEPIVRSLYRGLIEQVQHWLQSSRPDGNEKAGCLRRA